MTIEEINDLFCEVLDKVGQLKDNCCSDLFCEVLDKVGQLKDNCCSDLQYYSDKNIELLRDYNDLVDSHNNNVLFNIISMTIGFCIGVLVSSFC